MMVFKLSLALAVLIYFLGLISGKPMDKSLIQAMLYFIVFYSVISINQILYMYIKLQLIKLEEQRKEEEKQRQREERQARAAQTLVNFIKDPSNAES